MSKFASLTSYGASYEEIPGTKESLSTEEKEMIEKVKVQYAKDDKGNVTDRLCMCFYLKEHGERRYEGLDTRCDLKDQDEVDVNSVTFVDLTNGQKTITRASGKAL